MFSIKARQNDRISAIKEGFCSCVTGKYWDIIMLWSIYSAWIMPCSLHTPTNVNCVHIAEFSECCTQRLLLRALQLFCSVALGTSQEALVISLSPLLRKPTVHWSAPTLKPLTDEWIWIDHGYSAGGKPIKGLLMGFTYLKKAACHLPLCIV